MVTRLFRPTLIARRNAQYRTAPVYPRCLAPGSGSRVSARCDQWPDALGLLAIATGRFVRATSRHGVCLCALRAGQVRRMRCTAPARCPPRNAPTPPRRRRPSLPPAAALGGGAVLVAVP